MSTSCSAAREIVPSSIRDCSDGSRSRTPPRPTFRGSRPTPSPKSHDSRDALTARPPRWPVVVLFGVFRSARTPDHTDGVRIRRGNTCESCDGYGASRPREHRQGSQFECGTMSGLQRRFSFDVPASVGSRFGMTEDDRVNSERRCAARGLTRFDLVCAHAYLPAEIAPQEHWLGIQRWRESLRSWIPARLMRR